jgi:signal transduction histidine kinase
MAKGTALVGGRYSSPGATLTITVRPRDFQAPSSAPLSGQFVRVEIRDCGSGTSDEVRQHIFEPFFTTKDVGEGTRLGLSVVLEIVEDHGGTLELDTALGVGSAFSVYLRSADTATQ